jgi:glycosyltransferase involved in cell wall biosynthesis
MAAGGLSRAPSAGGGRDVRRATRTTETPVVPSVGILALVPDRWNDLWQPRHQILTRLARYFHVVWVNPALRWREVLTRRKAPSASSAVGHHEAGFTVYEPEFWLPQLYRPTGLARLTERLRLERARRVLAQRGCRTTVLYLWRPEFAFALRTVPADLSCYHIDDEYSFSTVEIPTPEAEARLIGAVDQVFIHSRALLEKKGGINPHTALVPNGVDYRAYARPGNEPGDLIPIARPRIGYTGHIKKQLDWGLLRRLAESHPQWSFVFVGAWNAHPEMLGAIQELSSRRNVHFLGRKSVHELAAYPQHFDVCIMPYQADGYTKYIYPLKLHEYLASGRPIVGTRIRSLEDFTSVVSLAATPEDWSAAIGLALAPDANSVERRAARRAVARQHDWALLVRQIAETISRRLGCDFAEPLDQMETDAEDGPRHPRGAAASGRGA